MGKELRLTVGWTVIEYDWHTYIAYRANQDGRDIFVSIYLEKLSLVAGLIS